MLMSSCRQVGSVFRNLLNGIALGKCRPERQCFCDELGTGQRVSSGELFPTSTHSYHKDYD